LTKNLRARITRWVSPLVAAHAATGARAVPSKASPADVRVDLEHAIVTDLAPAVAIALLATTRQDASARTAALQCLAAGVSTSLDSGKLRVQLLFENGAVLPVEMTTAAAHALMHGLSEELGLQSTR
jgi:hypothetical protein